MTQDKPLLKRIADGDIPADGYEPTQLWLIPILLRSRKRYYMDAVHAVERQLSNARGLYSRLYDSDDAFEQSSFVQGTWARASPLWWGLNDIIGFIDIRVDALERELQASLFLTTKRPSRALVDKTYAPTRRETVQIEQREVNENLRGRLSEIVHSLARDNAIKRRYINLEGWSRALDNTALIGVIRAEIALVSSLLEKYR